MIPKLLSLLACATEPTLEIVPSERGPSMVHVPSAVVRLGQRLTPPVTGFEWGPAPAGGAPAPTGAAPPATGPQGPPNQGGVPGAPPPRSSGSAPLLPAPSFTGSAPDLGLAPGGAHVVGRSAPDPLDARDVTVSAFWIDLTEVTQAQYSAFLADTGYRPPYVDEPWAEEGWSWDSADAPRKTADHPAVLTSWWDAREYCEWADKRLPTEAEWQLAVLGPADDERVFPWGDAYDGGKLNHGRLEVPNYDDSDGYERTSPVGSFPEGASRYGLLDSFGNAWEWTADRRVSSWDKVLGADGGRVDPHTTELDLYAAVRGGAYFFDLRPNPAGERNGFLSELRRKSSGFRCARADR